LNEKIRSGSFRSDVYYRLNVIALHLPPLRERKDDIPILASLFLDSLAAQESEKVLGKDALEVLCAYDWPGNVRELENALERAVVVASDSEISVEHLPEVVRATDAKPLITNETPPNPSMEVIERAYIEWVLTAEGGNKSKAAEVLGIDPSTLYRKLNRYGIGV
jgi:two-component system response regulator HydG